MTDTDSTVLFLQIFLQSINYPDLFEHRDYSLEGEGKSIFFTHINLGPVQGEQVGR